MRANKSQEAIQSLEDLAVVSRRYLEQGNGQRVKSAFFP